MEYAFAYRFLIVSEMNGKTMENYRILVINPGSTSTKVGVFEGETCLYEGTVRHSREELDKFPSIIDQAPMRMELIKSQLKENNIDLASIDGFIGRGGIVKPMLSGTYTVNDKLLYDLENLPSALSHASCLGGVFARELGEEYNKPYFIADPVVVDERTQIAKLTGLPGVERPCVFHCLNQKAVVRRYCKENGKKFDEANVIVAHMGGGITVGAHCRGMVIDVNDGINGEGPYSPERLGGMPVTVVLDLLKEGKYTIDQMGKLCSKAGGFVAHFGTNSALEVENRALAGDEQAKLVFDGVGYNVAKTIGSMAAVLKGEVDAVILTGGLAYSKYLCNYIKEMIGFIAPVCVYPGEGELEALAASAIRVLSGEEKAKEYQG